MKITYFRDDNNRVQLKAPRKIIFALDAELGEIFDSQENMKKYPELKNLWYNTVGETEMYEEDII